MNAKHGPLFWGGIFVALNLLSSVALADSAAPAVPVASADPKKLVAQAEKALDAEDMPVAMKLYLQAAELNYTPAQVALGEFAKSAQFYEEAVGWFLMAATQGNAAGQYDLAEMYAAGTGIEKDASKALYWVRRSAAKDYMPAAKMMTDIYRAGMLGMQADPEQAAVWAAKTARLSAIAKKEYDEKSAELEAAQKKLQEEKAAKAANENK